MEEEMILLRRELERVKEERLKLQEHCELLEQNKETENSTSKEDDIHAKERTSLEILEERLKAVEVGSDYEVLDMENLCLVSDVSFPPKFKTPDFLIFTGSECPQEHLRMYYRRMAAHIANDKLMMHVFQDSLGKGALKWYNQLDSKSIRTMRELINEFLKYYKESIYKTPDWLQLQKLSKRSTETFLQYAGRWREFAAKVRPVVPQKNLSKLFVDSLGPPYYAWLIGLVRYGFAEIVYVGRRYEEGLSSGKIMTHDSVCEPDRQLTPQISDHNSYNLSMRPSHNLPLRAPTYLPSPLNHLSTHQFFLPQPRSSYSPHHYQMIANATSFSTFAANAQQSMRNQQQPYFQPPVNSPSNPRPRPHFHTRRHRAYTPLPMSYAQLLPILLANKKIAKVPMNDLIPPFPPGYNENVRCEFHMGTAGHDVENCRFLKNRVQELLDAGMISFDGNGDMNMSTISDF